jgi:hypothetical protein
VVARLGFRASGDKSYTTAMIVLACIGIVGLVAAAFRPAQPVRSEQLPHPCCIAELIRTFASERLIPHLVGVVRLDARRRHSSSMPERSEEALSVRGGLGCSG